MSAYTDLLAEKEELEKTRGSLSWAYRWAAGEHPDGEANVTIGPSPSMRFVALGHDAVCRHKPLFLQLVLAESEYCKARI